MQGMRGHRPRCGRSLGAPRGAYVVINQLFLSPPAAGPRRRYGPDRVRPPSGGALVGLSSAGTAGQVVVPVPPQLHTVLPRTREVADQTFEAVCHCLPRVPQRQCDIVPTHKVMTLRSLGENEPEKTGNSEEKW